MQWPKPNQFGAAPCHALPGEPQSPLFKDQLSKGWLYGGFRLSMIPIINTQRTGAKGIIDIFRNTVRKHLRRPLSARCARPTIPLQHNDLVVLSSATVTAVSRQQFGSTYCCHLVFSEILRHDSSLPTLPNQCQHTHITARAVSVGSLQESSQMTNPESESLQTPIEIDCASVKAMLDRQEDFVLIDCREQNEHDLVHIATAQLWPMSELQARAADLETLRGKHLIVHCHHGGRSLQVANWLRGLDFDTAQSMAGGIDQWATEIEPGLPRY
jgi:rhodanese-related sulfurtransferase